MPGITLVCVVFNDLDVDFAIVLNPDVILQNDFSFSELSRFTLSDEFLVGGIVNQGNSQGSIHEFVPWSVLIQYSSSMMSAGGLNMYQVAASV